MSDIKRACGLLVIEVENSNPNGDPDRDGDPRQRPDGLGEISPVSFKRKLRDIVEEKDATVWSELKKAIPELSDTGFEVLEKRGRDRVSIVKEIQEDKFKAKYWDARLFGNTFLEEEGFIKKELGINDKEKIATAFSKLRRNIRTGVVQFGIGLSVKSVTIRRNSETNKAGVEGDKQQGFAPLGRRFVEYGVYTMPFFINPNAAGKTDCKPVDVELMLRLIPCAYPLNPSSVRPVVAVRLAHYIEHTSVLGSFPELEILRKLIPTVQSSQTTSVSDRFYKEYTVPTWESVKGEYAGKYHLYRELVSDKRDPAK